MTIASIGPGTKFFNDSVTKADFRAQKDRLLVNHVAKDRVTISPEARIPNLLKRPAPPDHTLQSPYRRPGPPIHQPPGRHPIHQPPVVGVPEQPFPIPPPIEKPISPPQSKWRNLHKTANDNPFQKALLETLTEIEE